MAPTTQAIAFDTRADQWSELRDTIDRRLSDLLVGTEADSGPLIHAMRTSTLAAGKRIRPMLLVLAARSLGHDSPALLDLGCAVEMVHTASLILDDLPCMDNASLRRGQPSLHRRVGEDVATLSAVALLTRAFALIAAVPDLPGAVRTQMVGYLAEAVGTQGLSRGQYEDLHDSCRLRPPADLALTNYLKTGILFEAALRMAARIAGADGPTENTLRHFALELGQAFQLFDDLTDGCADQGKDPHQDTGKATLVALLGTASARLRLAGHLAEAERQLAAIYEVDQPLRQFMGGLFSTFKSALAESADSELAPSL